MGAHSNYITIESDSKTIMFLFISVVVGIMLYFIFKIVTSLIKRHYYRKFRAEQHKVEQYKKMSNQKDKIYQNTVDNFIYNRITEDMLHIGSKINTKLVELYREEV